jgi:23S rRNA (cytidine2498-2'-O)-methyltransferase
VRRIHLCEPGWDIALADELHRVFPESRHQTLLPGWLESQLSPQDASLTPCVALATQCLPNPVDVAASSISKWVQLLGGAVIDRLRKHTCPWRLHVFSHYGSEEASGTRRCELIRQGLAEFLSKKQRRLLRTLQKCDMSAAWHPDEALVQLALATPTRGALSCCFAAERHILRRVLSRFPEGVVMIPPDPRAPSRAFRKLAEVELRLATPIAAGETCVDLGSSPGGWAYIALARGANVLAIDRSPLRDDLMAHPRLSFLKRDAFKYQPDTPVDWLLSDVVSFPPRIVELLDRWLDQGLCRRFCVTIKFRGADDYPKLEDVKRLLTGHNVDFCLRRLTANRNEVTAYGFQVAYGSTTAQHPAIAC